MTILSGVTSIGKDKVTTLVTNALPNTIYGTPMKSGAYTVTVTATAAGKATETFKMIVRADGEAVVDAEVVLTDAIGAIASTGTVPGKVTGMGVCAKGKTLTLKGVFDAGGVKNDRPVYYTATSSAVVCATSYDPFVGQVIICFAPNGGKSFNGYVRVVSIGDE